MSDPTYWITGNDLNEALGTSYTTHDEALRHVRDLVHKVRLVEANPSSARDDVIIDLQTRAKSAEEFAKVQVDDLQCRVTKLEDGAPVKATPFRFEQTVIPVSQDMRYDASTRHGSFTTVKFRGLVFAGAEAAAPVNVTLELGAATKAAQKLHNGVNSRKKYKLILEETEETF
jgi:hypothetical protein